MLVEGSNKARKQLLNIPSASKFSPTVIDKSQPIESTGSRLRDKKYKVVEACQFLYIIAIYT